MDIDELRRIKMVEIEQKSRQRAVDEVIALKAKYKDAKDLTYAFEHNGQTIKGAFVTASLCSPDLAANFYQIEVLVPPQVVVEGQCYLHDTKGQRLAAGGKTAKGAKQNRVILDTLALK